MKINRASIVLLCLAGISIIIYLIYTLFMPDNDLFSSVDTEYEQINITYESISRNLKMLKTYEKVEEDLQNEIKRLNIIHNIYLEEVINILNYVLETCNINANKITFSEIQTVYIIDETISESIKQTTATEEGIEMTAMTVSIEFSSTYNDLLMFVDQIQSYETEIGILNIRILYADGGEGIQCFINLNFYAMPL